MARPQKGGTTRLRIVTLSSYIGDTYVQSPPQGALLVRAEGTMGEHQAWALDLSASGGDVTLPLGAEFAGGKVYLYRAGVDGFRQLDLLPYQDDNLLLTMNTPSTVAPGSALPVALGLSYTESDATEGSASLSFRRVFGVPNGDARSWEPSIHIQAGGMTTVTVAAPSEPGLWLLMASASTANGPYTHAWTVIDVQPGLTLQLPAPPELRTAQPQDVAINLYNPTGASLSAGHKGGYFCFCGGRWQQRAERADTCK